MHATMSTLTWMTFDAAAPTAPPFAAAPAEQAVAAGHRAGFGTVGLDLVTLGGADGRIDAPVSDVGVLRVGTADATPAARRLAAVAAASGAALCSVVLEARPDDVVLDRLRGAADVLAAGGVRLALEFMAYGPLGTLAGAVGVCERIGWARCGVLLDSWHLMHAGTPWEQVAALTADQVALVQVSDTERLAEDADEFFRASRWGRVPPGEGSLDFTPFLDAVDATGYDGWLSPEVLSFGAAVGDVDECARRLRRAVEHLGAA